MKQSARAKRMARHHGRMNKQSKLNLTSLMDIFTILVFFLMVNSSEVQVLEDTKDITMPKSIADQKPKETLLIQVSDSSLVVAGRKIADTSAVTASKDGVIPSLDEELKYQASRRPEMTEEEKQFGRKITIQGDKNIPYDILKKIMATCAQAEFRDISLAVSKKAQKSSVPAAGEG
ncbi:Uncharacterised protein [BD1-7 clade bacterium]|uniref:Biopolymer transport protein ExbD n=1 Tax=BD1-7 clade bacterium TaxID=2029982 RepID=A0A5S9NS43_9GAMM|nr:Uncharacterised protein [BD1-7 clade bacterium]CAA0093349.1 Uncharacterised protein [BD1-7 clade bacterium]